MKTINNIFSLKYVPHNVSEISTFPNYTFPTPTINFNFTPEIFHTKISNGTTQDYYENYFMTTDFQSPTRIKLSQNQIDRIVEIKGKGCSFLEIGCGIGDFLKMAKPNFSRVVGIEPSKRYAEEAKKNGLEVVNDYADNPNLSVNGKFDAFGSRQVFEHVPNPVAVLSSIKRFLNYGAVGFIEVPNGYRALREGRFYEFFPDHIQYYSANSLVSLATICGFSVIECKETLNSDYLELWMRYDNNNYQKMFLNIATVRDKICNEIHYFIDKNNGKSIALWGVGAKTLSLFSYDYPYLNSKIKYVIDDDTYKDGKYIPNTPIPIVSSDKLKELNIDIIIIMALSFREVIKNKILSILPSYKEIYTIDNNHKIVRITYD